MTEGPLLSADKTAQRLDMASSTLWRMERDGLLVGCRIYSKKYYTLESIQAFERRAMAGEFARPARGAAAASAARKNKAKRIPP